MDINKYSPQVQRLIEKKKISEIAILIKQEKIEWDKELLMFQNDKGWSVAHEMASNSCSFKDTKWVSFIEDKEILKLGNNRGNSVAHELARLSFCNKWNTFDKEILMLRDIHNNTVAYYLAKYSNFTKWTITDKEILMLRNMGGNSVAHELAKNHPSWVTDDLKILNLINNEGDRVKDILKKKGRI